MWDDPEWQKSHQDADSARAEQRAGKDYREKQEKARQERDLSTQAAINEKFAVGDYLASQPGKEYTEVEKETKKFWDTRFACVDYTMSGDDVMTVTMVVHIVMIVLMYACLIWMLKRKRALLRETKAQFLKKNEIWFLVGTVMMLMANAIMLVVQWQLRTGKTMAVSIMVGFIGCFLLVFVGPNFRMFIYLIELFVENNKRKKEERSGKNPGL